MPLFLHHSSAYISYCVVFHLSFVIVHLNRPGQKLENMFEQGFIFFPTLKNKQNEKQNINLILTIHVQI